MTTDTIETVYLLEGEDLPGYGTVYRTLKVAEKEASRLSAITGKPVEVLTVRRSPRPARGW